MGREGLKSHGHCKHAALLIEYRIKAARPALDSVT
jgi:hypothetical protein